MTALVAKAQGRIEELQEEERKLLRAEAEAKRRCEQEVKAKEEADAAAAEAQVEQLKKVLQSCFLNSQGTVASNLLQVGPISLACMQFLVRHDSSARPERNEAFA